MGRGGGWRRKAAKLPTRGGGAGRRGKRAEQKLAKRRRGPACPNWGRLRSGAGRQQGAWSGDGRRWRVWGGGGSGEVEDARTHTHTRARARARVRTHAHKIHARTCSCAKQVQWRGKGGERGIALSLHPPPQHRARYPPTTVIPRPSFRPSFRRFLLLSIPPFLLAFHPSLPPSLSRPPLPPLSPLCLLLLLPSPSRYPSLLRRLFRDHTHTRTAPPARRCMS